jgi:acetylglutamate kinase
MITNRLSVIKIGGNIIDNEKQLKLFLNNFKQIDGLKILVHGGGKIATNISNSLKIKSKIIDGRRITNKSTLDIITMVYAGKINKNIVSNLQSINCNAIGLSGPDGNTIEAKKRKVNKINYGFVGDIKKINTELLILLLNNKYFPVICSLSHDKQGQILNTNADTIAASIAVGLSSKFNVALYYCFEKNGVLNSVDDEENIIDEINPNSYYKLKSEGIINSGMIPKIDNCFDALRNGVKTVKIGSIKMIKSNINHTSIVLQND